MSFGCPQINDMNEHKHNYNMKINCLLALALSASSLAAQDAVIRVDAGKVENKITPYLYGACMEDVNHEIYGGLYDQKFRREFEEPVSMDNLSGLPVVKGCGSYKMANFPYRHIREQNWYMMTRSFPTERSGSILNLRTVLHPPTMPDFYCVSVNMEAGPITSMDMRSVCLLMESACC